MKLKQTTGIDMAKTTYTYKQANLPTEALDNINEAHELTTLFPVKVRKADLWVKASEWVIEEMKKEAANEV